MTAQQILSFCNSAYNQPPAKALYPDFSNLSAAVFNKLLGHVDIGRWVSGSKKLTKKNGTLSSQGILLKVVRSGTAIMSL